MPAERAAGSSTPTRLRRRRPGDHQLWLAAALAVLAETAWRLVILDEAQAIKNPNAKQTTAAKALKAQARIALTGTPVENRLGDLWSIFDFINPGLLGTRQGFRQLRQAPGRAAAQPVRPAARAGTALHPAPHEDRQDASSPTCRTRPRSRRYCPLSRRQAALYQQSGGGSGRSSWRTPTGIQPQGPRAGVPDALQADLQPSLAVAGRRRLGRGGQRQVGAPARDRRGDRRQAGEDAGLHPVPRDDRRRWRRSWAPSSAAPGWCCTAPPR